MLPFHYIELRVQTQSTSWGQVPSPAYPSHWVPGSVFHAVKFSREFEDYLETECERSGVLLNLSYDSWVEFYSAVQVSGKPGHCCHCPLKP